MHWIRSFAGILFAKQYSHFLKLIQLTIFLGLPRVSRFKTRYTLKGMKMVLGFCVLMLSSEFDIRASLFLWSKITLKIIAKLEALQKMDKALQIFSWGAILFRVLKVETYLDSLKDPIPNERPSSDFSTLQIAVSLF